MKSYIYGLFDQNNKQIDQTSLDEQDKELAYSILVEEEKRNPDGLRVCFIDEVEE